MGKKRDAKACMGPEEMLGFYRQALTSWLSRGFGSSPRLDAYMQADIDALVCLPETFSRHYNGMAVVAKEAQEHARIRA